MALKVDLSGSCFCVITGSSQGIGRALAVEFAKHLGPGSVMVLMARNQGGLEATKSLVESPNIRVIVKTVDLSQASARELEDLMADALVDCDKTKFDHNIMVHNAGSLGDLSLSAMQLDDIEGWRKYYDLNVFYVSVLNCLFLKVFEKQASVIVVNITSLCGIKPFAGMPLYCSGKAAREMYFKVLAEENPKIKVLNYSPGPVQTAMVQSVINTTHNEELRETFKTSQRENRLLKPEETAAKCLQVLCNGNYKSGDHVDYYD